MEIHGGVELSDHCVCVGSKYVLLMKKILSASRIKTVGVVLFYV